MHQQANYEKSVFAKTNRTNARGEGELPPQPPLPSLLVCYTSGLAVAAARFMAADAKETQASSVRLVAPGRVCLLHSGGSPYAADENPPALAKQQRLHAEPFLAFLSK